MTVCGDCQETGYEAEKRVKRPARTAHPREASDQHRLRSQLASPRGITGITDCGRDAHYWAPPHRTAVRRSGLRWVTVTVYLIAHSSGGSRPVSPATRGFGGGLPGARRRPSRRSSVATLSCAPSGRPMVAPARSEPVVAGSPDALRSAAKSGINVRKGATVASSSSSPTRWPRALDHGQSPARLTSPATTGLGAM
jgi:hypothetical protein